MVLKRRWLHLIVGLALGASLLLGSAGVPASASDAPPAPEAEEPTIDMELVLLRDDGRIYVQDPYVKAGDLAVTFESDQLTGDWQLLVSDNAAVDEGTLNSWGIEFMAAECE